jgi:ADP-heptose:LPS heptosyltransferase
MKLKSFDNINMPRLSKNQKVRRDTLDLLERNKDKLNRLTYLSLRNRINEKRIDAVKNIADKLKDIKLSTEKNIVLKDLRKAGERVKQKASTRIQKAFIKRNTEVLTTPSVNDVL